MKRLIQKLSAGVAAAVWLGTSGAHGGELAEETLERAEDLADRTIAFLAAQQDESTGGWSVNPDGPDLPGISALVLRGMLMDESADEHEAVIERGVSYLLGKRREDGGIHDGILPTYNTALSVSALALLDDDRGVSAQIQGFAEYLKALQWGPGAAEGREDVASVERADPFYGGFGYGFSGRPDLSNTSIVLDALHDAGVEGDDPAFERALVFLQRVQMLDETEAGVGVNDMAYAEGSTQGGFIYSTSPDGERKGEGESKAGMIEERVEIGRSVSRLRAYGSMTYAGFKSYLYADLDRDDPRVRAALEWLEANFTVAENPGIGTDGYYYYLVTMARALNAWGEDVIVQELDWSGMHDALWSMDEEREPYEIELASGETVRLRLERGEVEGSHRGRVVGEVEGGGRFEGWRSDIPNGVTVTITREIDWREALIDRLAELQEADGSFAVLDDRWMEDNRVLIAGYVLVALQETLASARD